MDDRWQHRTAVVFEVHAQAEPSAYHGCVRQVSAPHVYEESLRNKAQYIFVSTHYHASHLIPVHALPACVVTKCACRSSISKPCDVWYLRFAIVNTIVTWFNVHRLLVMSVNFAHRLPENNVQKNGDGTWMDRVREVNESIFAKVWLGHCACPTVVSVVHFYLLLLDANQLSQSCCRRLIVQRSIAWSVLTFASMQCVCRM